MPDAHLRQAVAAALTDPAVIDTITAAVHAALTAPGPTWRHARSIGRRAHKLAPAVLTRRQLAHALCGQVRRGLDVGAVIAEAERYGFIVATVDGGWTAGHVVPL